jgi:hypothetical protein
MFDLQINIKTPYLDEEVKNNILASKKYPYVLRGHNRQPSAVVGGAPSVLEHLEELRNWSDEIYAINDTAGWLSELGIVSYLVSVDMTPKVFRRGNLIRGAFFATRCNPSQFIYDNTHVFTVAADDETYGIGGGTSTACVMVHLCGYLGHRKTYLFGCDGSYKNDFNISSTADFAYQNMFIVRSGGRDFITNPNMFLQSQYLSGCCRKYPNLIINKSNGLLRSMIKWEKWEIVAVSEDMKKGFEGVEDTGRFKNKYQTIGLGA